MLIVTGRDTLTKSLSGHGEAALSERTCRDWF